MQEKFQREGSNAAVCVCVCVCVNSDGSNKYVPVYGWKIIETTMF